MPLELSSSAIERGKGLGLSVQDIHDMAYRAAGFTHPIGNVRYKSYWFTVLENRVWAMGVIGEGSHGSRVVFIDAVDCTYCDGTMRTIMIDEDGRTEQIIACPRMNNRGLELCDQ